VQQTRRRLRLSGTTTKPTTDTANNDETNDREFGNELNDRWNESFRHVPIRVTRIPWSLPLLATVRLIFFALGLAARAPARGDGRTSRILEFSLFVEGDSSSPFRSTGGAAVTVVFFLRFDSGGVCSTGSPILAVQAGTKFAVFTL